MHTDQFVAICGYLKLTFIAQVPADFNMAHILNNGLKK